MPVPAHSPSSCSVPADAAVETAAAAATAAPDAEPGQPLPAAISRRNLLRNAGAAALGATALTVAAGQPQAAAQSASPSAPLAAMRSPQRPAAWGAAGVEAAPAPEIIALNRMAFGPRPGDLDALLALGASSEERLAAYVEQQLQPAAIDDSGCDALLAGLNLTTLTKSLTQLWQDHVLTKPAWAERILPASETRIATFVRAVYSRRQLSEVLADFWHNHFNVYAFDYWAGPVWVHYDRDVIRANLLGNFRQMLSAVATSPAMLYYLDNVSNDSAGPNENFARELFELHTLGAMNYFGVVTNPDSVPVDGEGRPIGYQDTDVYGATRSFTGWRVDPDTGQFVFDSKAHDRYSKTVLGVRLDDFLGIDDGNTVLDLLASHPGTGRHIATKLCRRLISDNPPQAVVDAAAAVFYEQRNAPDQLAQVLRAILLSNEFRTTWAQKIKRPLEYTASLLRASNADFVTSDSFFWIYERLGQPLFQWQPPNGFPDLKEDWSSTMPMLQRWRLCNWLIDGWRYGGDGPDKDNLRINLNAQMPPAYKTPEQIVDFWANRILGRALPPAERAPIVDFMAYGRNLGYELPAKDIEERLRFMVGLIFMAPSFQWR